MDDCLFCQIAEKKIPSKQVYENDDVYAFHDINPQAPTHIIIIPKVHIGTLDEINEKNSDMTAKLILAAVKIAKKQELEGYRLVINCNEIAGQTVFHLHCHLLGGRNMHWPPG
jgi:histidine triad (HIT) family protein